MTSWRLNCPRSAGMRYSHMTRVGTCTTRRCSGNIPARLSAAAAIRHAPGSAVIAASAFAHKAMAAPAVAVAPSAPGAHAQENPVVKIPWPVIAIGRACIRRITVIAIGANWLDANVDINLCLGRRCKSQAGNQCSCTNQNFHSTHSLTPLGCLRFPASRWVALRPSRRTQLQQPT
jgi:hypothetical protein